MEHNRIPEDVIWEVCETIFTGEHHGAAGARNIEITLVLAIPVAEDGAWRHCQVSRGKPIFAVGGHGAS